MAIIKFVLWGVLGFVLALSGVNIIDSPMETLGILAIVLGIDITSALS